MTEVEHTLDALVEHVRLQGHLLRYYLAIERPYVVRLELTSAEQPGMRLLIEVSGNTRNDIIEEATKALEFVRGPLVGSLIGPVVSLANG